MTQSVLVVDDEPFVLESARSFLERFGNMQVSTAASAQQALSMLTDQKFDALVLDYALPEISGLDLLKILRTKGDTTPVIIFTGVGREHAAIEALNNGADFFLKKGESPSTELRELVHMINQAAERRLVGRSLGASEKLLGETVGFFSDPAYAIDRESKVVAWNKGMETLTGISASSIIGKKNGAHALPFFGKPSPMLTELVFEKDEAIRALNYTITDRDGSTICAWTVVRTKEGVERVLWMKASALHDAKGTFIASLGSVRDITDDLGEELLRQVKANEQEQGGTESTISAHSRVFGKLIGRANSSHREGLRLSYREGKYEEAITHFDNAIEIDPAHAAAWHDRGVCLRELGKESEALKSFIKSVELSPEDQEFLYSSAELLRRIGILRGQKTHIEAAVATLNRIVELNPNHAEAWNSLGICMKDLGKDVQAARYFERANGIIRQNKASKKVRNLDTIV